MTRDGFQILVTAILIVLGLVALEPTTLGGDRGRALEPCEVWQSCWLPLDPNGDRSSP